MKAILTRFDFGFVVIIYRSSSQPMDVNDRWFTLLIDIILFLILLVAISMVESRGGRRSLLSARISQPFEVHFIASLSCSRWLNVIDVNPRAMVRARGPLLRGAA